jgi:F420-0:gamma-glutamyl ligase
VQGRDGLHEALARELPNGCTLTYYEMDSDIFGDELETAQYAEVDRIAAVAVIIDRDAA